MSAESGEIHDDVVSSPSTSSTSHSPMAMGSHRKVKRLKVSFNDDVKVIIMSELYLGERFLENIKSTIRRNKEQSHVDLLKSDGSATKFCVDRPAHKLVHIGVSQITGSKLRNGGKL